MASGTFATTFLDVNLQDATAGISVYRSGAPPSIIRGNNYIVEGILKQYNGKAELVPDNITDVINFGSGTLPEPFIISISDLLTDPESYEGLLIQIQQLSNTGNGNSWPSEGNWANLEVTDDGEVSVLTLRIDSNTEIDGTSEPLWPKDIVGIFNQYATYAPYNWGYQIMPRDLNDFSSSVSVQLSIFLEGPYDVGISLMSSSLNSTIPLTSPYAENPRKILSMPNNIIDWVLVQLRSTENGSAVTSHSALLNKDGRIVADNGTTSTNKINC